MSGIINERAGEKFKQLDDGRKPWYVEVEACPPPMIVLAKTQSEARKIARAQFNKATACEWDVDFFPDEMKACPREIRDYEIFYTDDDDEEWTVADLLRTREEIDEDDRQAVMRRAQIPLFSDFSEKR